MTTKQINDLLRLTRNDKVGREIIDCVMTFYRNKRVTISEFPFRIGNEKIWIRLKRECKDCV